MELRQLRYFLAVADRKNFTRAAERVRVSQSALSQQIQKLEDDLDVKLIDRLNQGAELTEAGELFEVYARRALGIIDDARSAMNRLQSGETGSVTIGTVQTVNEYLLPDVLAELAERHPGVEICVEEASGPGVERGVVDGDFDLGIGFAPPELDGLEAEALQREELVVLTGPDHPVAGRQTLPVEALGDHALAMLSDAFSTRRLLDRAVGGSSEATLDVAFEMNSIPGILATVQRTDLATVLPRMTLRMPSAGPLISTRLVDPTPSRTVGLLFRSGSFVGPAVETTARLLRARLEGLNRD